MSEILTTNLFAKNHSLIQVIRNEGFLQKNQITTMMK